jgi:hypothetical protein
MNTQAFLKDLTKRLPVIEQGIRDVKNKRDRESLAGWIEIMRSQVRNLLSHGDTQIEPEGATIKQDRAGATPRHTPGPWFWHGETLRTRAAMGRDAHWNGWIVRFGANEVGQWAVAEDNRALIAAAPQLHAALRALVAIATPLTVPMGDGPDPFPAEFAPAVEDARALLGMLDAPKS